MMLSEQHFFDDCVDKEMFLQKGQIENASPVKGWTYHGNTKKTHSSSFHGKSPPHTGKFLSEALIFASTN